MAKSKNFIFDGGAATYLGTGILGFLITILSLGLFYPYALVLRQRWIAKHTYVKGFQLKFNGRATDLFFQWIKWFLLIVITFGIYSFWVMPRLQRWITEHTDFAPQKLSSPKIDDES